MKETVTLMKCQWPTMAFEIIIHKMMYYFFFVDGNGLEYFLNNQKENWKLMVSLKKRKGFGVSIRDARHVKCCDRSR